MNQRSSNLIFVYCGYLYLLFTVIDIPYLGVILKDIGYLDETIPWRQREMINFDKVKLIGEMIDNFIQIQKLSKKIVLAPLPKVRVYILTAEVWDEADFVKIAQVSTLHYHANLLSASRRSRGSTGRFSLPQSASASGREERKEVHFDDRHGAALSAWLEYSTHEFHDIQVQEKWGRLFARNAEHASL